MRRVSIPHVSVNASIKALPSGKVRVNTSVTKDNTKTSSTKIIQPK